MADLLRITIILIGSVALVSIGAIQTMVYAQQYNNSTNDCVPGNVGAGDCAFDKTIPCTQGPCANSTLAANSGSNNSGTNITTNVGANPSIAGISPMQEFGVFFGPIQVHSGTFHNEKGVFVPWTTICKAGQSYLLESCDSLVNPDGSLTPAGDKAVSCIWNGAVLSTAGAAYLHLPIDTIKSILGPLAGLTGCNGIVNMNQIPNSAQVQSLLQFAATFAQQH